MTPSLNKIKIFVYILVALGFINAIQAISYSYLVIVYPLLTLGSYLLITKTKHILSYLIFGIIIVHSLLGDIFSTSSILFSRSGFELPLLLLLNLAVGFVVSLLLLELITRPSVKNQLLNRSDAGNDYKKTPMWFYLFLLLNIGIVAIPLILTGENILAIGLYDGLTYRYLYTPSIFILLATYTLIIRPRLEDFFRAAIWINSLAWVYTATLLIYAWALGSAWTN